MLTPCQQPLTNLSWFLRILAGAAKRRLTQDTTPLQFNVTFGSVSEISADQAEQIQNALTASLTAPEASEVYVSSNTIVQDDQLTVIILVYPSSDADAATLQSELEALGTGSTFENNLRAADLDVSSITVNSVKPQAANQGVQRSPVTGSSLAGEAIHLNHLCAYKGGESVAYMESQFSLKFILVCRGPCCHCCRCHTCWGSSSVWCEKPSSDKRSSGQSQSRV